MAASSLVDFTRRYRLSHYLQIRFSNTGLIAESLITGNIRTLNASAACIFLSFEIPRSLEEVIARYKSSIRASVTDHLVGCVADGMLTEVLDDGTAAEDRISALRAWEPHDLEFHLRSRRGRYMERAGATWHLRGALPPELLQRRDTNVGLHRHCFCSGSTDLAALNDLTLDQALQRRRTRYSVMPVSEPALGALLFSSCRITDAPSPGNDLARRPYPSGGCRHSLEVYVLVHRCPTIESGAYRYDPFDHGMVFLRREDSSLLTLLREAQVSTGTLPALPSVLLIFTSRIYRVTEKYQAIGYRLVLLEMGALYQTIYLAANALNLSVAAIGTGDSDCFSKSLGTDFFSEPSVGEMILGGAATA